MTNENKQALEALEELIKHVQELSGKYSMFTHDRYHCIKNALQPKPNVDVEALKADIHNILAGSEDIDKSQWDIADEAVDYLHSQGHLNQGWRDIKDLKRFVVKAVHNGFGWEQVEEIFDNYIDSNGKTYLSQPPKSEDE